jgi:hypothetical protein
MMAYFQPTRCVNYAKLICNYVTFSFTNGMIFKFITFKFITQDNNNLSEKTTNHRRFQKARLLLLDWPEAFFEDWFGRS